jgi:hypothetical protein
MIKNEINLYIMFISDEISSLWKPKEREEEKKSPLERGYKKSSSKLYNGKNRKRRIKQ